MKKIRSRSNWKDTFPRVKGDACVTECSSVIIPNVENHPPWVRLKKGSRIYAKILRPPENRGGSLSCTRKVVGSTGGCALADTAAKTPPGRQGLANITGQQCADRHHATRLLFRGASLWARAIPRDSIREHPRRSLHQSKWFVVKKKKSWMPYHDIITLARFGER